jgi:uncharacterized protein (TIGR03435 family)
MHDLYRIRPVTALAAALLASCAAHALIAQAANIPTQVSSLSSQFAQSQTPASTDAAIPTYDVISIKPNKSTDGRPSIDYDHGIYSATDISLKMMILDVYDLKEEQLFGLPKWGDELRFDIQAKIVDSDKGVLDSLTHAQERGIQQPILTDRFQLRFHEETKVLPVYELVIVKGGPKFQPSTFTGHQKGANGLGAGSLHTNNHGGNLDMTSTAVPMSSLVNVLSRQAQRIVVDKTGLTGKYDLNLSWSRDDGSATATDSNDPSILTALQEQLGLRLQPAKSQVKTLVIDHVEKPSEN